MVRSLSPVFGALLVLCSSAAAAGSSVKLIDAGAAPHELVRYQFKSGLTERGVMDMDMQMGVSMGGQEVPMGAMPATRMTLQMRVAEVATDGTARMEFEVVSAEAAGASPEAASVNQSLAMVKGISGWYQMDSYGQVTDGGVKLPQGTAAALGEAFSGVDQSMQQVNAAFPSEPIGVGARWQVTQKVDSGGIQLTQLVEYTLRSRKGNSVEMEMTLIGGALDAAGAMPPGAKVDAMEVTGNGTLRMQLDRLVPVSTMDTAITMAMSMSMQGQTQSLGMNMNMRQSMAPAPK